MRRTVLLLLGLFVFAVAVMGQYNFQATCIPDSLKQDAGAVVRYYSTVYDRKSSEKYTVDVHIAITILNQGGKDKSELVIYYDRNSKVTKIKGSIYNAMGKVVSELKKSDLRDYAINADYTLFSDSRAIHFRPAVSSFPVTIEYSYTIEHTGTVGFNTWLPQKGFGVSVEQAELVFNTPAGNDIRFRELNHRFTSKVVETGKGKTYKWQVSNLVAVEDELKAPAFLDIMPAVLLAPENIGYEGTTGDFSSWSGYGKWVNTLIANRDVLPDATVKHIQALTAELPDVKSKAQVIYRYMQGRTRYVNIALGIGGFQPMEAAVVDEKGYGDCKALSNYTKALLKVAGIESYYAEIGTGKYHDIRFTDFSSSNQTNHVMLCVPLESDTVWLECTNQQIPFGYIGLSSQNRYALLVGPEGGKLARTTTFENSPNTRISKLSCTIGEEGEAAFALTATFRNNQYDEVSSLINMSPKEQKEILLKAFSGVRPITVNDFNIGDNSDTCFISELSVHGSIGSYPSKAGSRLIFEPLFFFHGGLTGPLPEKRKLPVVEPVGYTFIDSFHVNLPQSYSVEYLPEPRTFSNCYASYSYEVLHDGQTITVIRKLTINKGTYPQPQFADINDFMKAVASGESRKIIVKEGG